MSYRTTDPTGEYTVNDIRVRLLDIIKIAAEEASRPLDSSNDWFGEESWDRGFRAASLGTRVSLAYHALSPRSGRIYPD